MQDVGKLPMAMLLQEFAGLVAAEHAGDNVARAVQLYAAAEGLFRSMGVHPVIEVWRVPHQETLSRLRKHLGDVAFTAAWAEGQAMTLEQAVAYALEESETAVDEGDTDGA